MCQSLGILSDFFVLPFIMSTIAGINDKTPISALDFPMKIEPAQESATPM